MLNHFYVKKCTDEQITVCGRGVPVCVAEDIATYMGSYNLNDKEFY